MYQFLSMGVYISGLHSLRKRKKKKLTSHLLWILITLDNLNSYIQGFQIFRGSLFQFVTYLSHLYIFWLFLFLFFFFFGNFLLINNLRSRNNICDLRSLSYNKLVDEDKNDNIILSVIRILGKFNTENKNVKILFLCP